MTAPSSTSPTRLLDEHSGVVHLPDVAERHPAAVLVHRLLGPTDAPVVAVLGGVSAHRTAWDHDGSGRTAWWPEQVGPGRPIDPARHRILTLDWIGGPDGSEWVGCAGRGRPPAAPRVQARALLTTLDRLGIERLHAVVGASFGGMVALTVAALAPERVDRIAVLSAAHESAPATTALRSVQRRIVRLGVERGVPQEALALARALAMIGYRSPQELAVRFPGPAAHDRGAVRHRVDDWLEHVGPKILDRFDPASYLSLSEGLDVHRVRPEDVRVPVFAWGAWSDGVVPMSQMEAMVGRLSGPSVLVQDPSIHGHDAFLKAHEAVGRFLRRAVDGPLPRWKEVVA